MGKGIKRKARCAHPGCQARPANVMDGRLFYLGDAPAAWVCNAHAELADELLESTVKVAAEGARLVGERLVHGVANKLAGFLFGDGR